MSLLAPYDPHEPRGPGDLYDPCDPYGPRDPHGPHDPHDRNVARLVPMIVATTLVVGAAQKSSGVAKKLAELRGPALHPSLKEKFQKNSKSGYEFFLKTKKFGIFF